MKAKIKFTIPKRLEVEFKRKAKETFDKECYGYLIGTIAGDSLTADEIWWPDDMKGNTSAFGVAGDVATVWLAEAMDYAKENDSSILGEIHSHPYTYREAGRKIIDRALSEQDLDAQQIWHPLILGLCVVQEMERKGNRILRSSVRWWGPTLNVDVNYV